MIGVNHALVGGLVGKFVPWPIAIPLALASHFALDAMPHYGIPHQARDHSWFWKVFFTLDAFATLGLAMWSVYYGHYAMCACGLAAVLPDFIWVASVIRHRSFSLAESDGRFARWHKKIQKYEFQGGIWIELPLAIALFFIVLFPSL